MIKLPFRRNVRCRVFRLLAAVVLTSLTAAAWSGETPRSRFFALCIGLRYPGTEMALEYSAADSRKVADAFRNASGYRAADTDIVALVDDDPRVDKPTRENILGHVRKMAAQSGVRDRMVVFYSGHGTLDSQRRASIVASGARNIRDEQNLVPFAEIKEIMASSSAENKLLIIDACHSGGGKSLDSGVTPDDIARALNLERGAKGGGADVAWLSSCQASERSWEDDELGQGVFTHFLLDALGPRSQEIDISRDGMISVEELHFAVSDGISDYLRRKFKDSHKRYQRRQSPQVGWGGGVADDTERLRRVNVFYPIGDVARVLTPEPTPTQTQTRMPEVPPLSPAPSPAARTQSSASPSTAPATRNDPSMTFEQYCELAEKGDVSAQYRLGYAYCYGAEVRGRYVHRDYVKAARWLRMAADRDNADAQKELAGLYQFGRGVDKNDAEAMRWYRRAADQGNADAQWWLGNLGGAPGSAWWYRLAADQGHVLSSLYLANMYRKGAGVDKDYAEALRLYRLAADQNNGEAERRINDMYNIGQVPGTEKYFEAMRKYTLGAEQGDAYTQYYIGNLYSGVTTVVGDDGDIVDMDKNYSEAIKWYRLAADQGFATAQTRLGSMYESGEGVSKDIAEAMRFYRLAAAQGDKDAKDALKRLGAE